ncbi:MAG: hypothetical protein WC872_03780 [Candidatus Absconditabacterales bacterium]
MVNNKVTNSEANENLNNGTVLEGKSAGENFLDKIKRKHPDEYEKYKNAKTKAEKKSYENFLKTEFKLLNPLHDFIITNKLVPTKNVDGKEMSLEDYLKKVIDKKDSLKDLVAEAIQKANTEEKLDKKKEDLSEVEKLKKQLDDKDSEIKDLKAKSFFEHGKNPEKEKLNAWLFSMGAKQGVLRTQMLTPKGMVRRMKLNRIAKSLQKIDKLNLNDGDRAEKGVRYILNMTSFWKGGRLTSSLRRGIRGWIGYARKNPDKFGKQFKEKFNNFIPKPDLLKNKDEKQFAEYIKAKAEKFRDDFVDKQVGRRNNAKQDSK